MAVLLGLHSFGSDLMILLTFSLFEKVFLKAPGVSTPPSFLGLRIPMSKPPKLQMLTLDFQGVNKLYNKRLSQSLNPSVSQHLQSLKIKDYKLFLSLTIFKITK